ncbi:MAG TPA: 4-hydroxythreonine-4-phosphate dehydrogenase PdxA [Longimicrobiales bacterium]|nr:4-hydroxythreonine-4-phosphate dehydrogenase PdxA [Longimicrobiales bacterium]
MELKPVRLAISLGDPRGIGPEVTIAATRKLRAQGTATFVFVGPDDSPARPFADQYISVGSYRADSEASAGLVAGLAIEKAVELVTRGEVDAIVTAPIDKHALHEGGYNFPGHTELLAHLAGDVPVVMMLAAEATALGGALRVVLATTHIPLAQVPRAVTSDLLVEQVEISARALHTGWQLAAPRVALCAFNPHASDGGLFGDEEKRVYQPAIARLRASGINVSDPLPADTVFLRAARGEFDVVVAPYHDVGMAAFKTAAFGQGVNVTLGLPFVRTSPDHGTAFDIAGQGAADSSSMEEAIRLAIRLVK